MKSSSIGFTIMLKIWRKRRKLLHSISPSIMFPLRCHWTVGTTDQVPKATLRYLIFLQIFSKGPSNSNSIEMLNWFKWIWRLKSNTMSKKRWEVVSNSNKKQTSVINTLVLMKSWSIWRPRSVLGTIQSISQNLKSRNNQKQYKKKISVTLITLKNAKNNNNKKKKNLKHHKQKLKNK